MSYLFTSESVSEGHPDKVADQISDALLDEFLAYDKNSKVACETLVTTGQVVLAGEVKSSAYVDVQDVARNVIEKIGYTKSEYQFEAKSCGVFSSIHEQSGDINRGVEREDPYNQGAGDQGMMFGYACNETEEFMPLAITLAHRLAKRLTEARTGGLLGYLRPDGKTQVTVEYDGNVPKRVEAVVVSAQHDETVTQEKLRADIIEHIIKETVPAALLDENTRIYVNPTGRFLIGGPEGDSGLTGRKIIVDTYGGACAHGGGAFSGKDPTKVDRSATYMARYICKNAVCAGLCDKIELQIAYAIGVSRPVSVFVDTFGTGKLPDGEIADILVKEFDMRPLAIINKLDLRRPIYSQTAAYGHFGKPYLPWEQCDKAEDLKKYLR